MIVKLIRRYKYMEKTLEDHFKKIIVFLKGFTPEERVKLANLTAILISGGQVPPSVLTSALQDHFVKEGIALDFLVVVLRTWLLVSACLSSLADPPALYPFQPLTDPHTCPLLPPRTGTRTPSGPR